MKRILIFLGAVSLVGCKKYLDVNTNPNTPTSTRSTFVFTNAETRTAGIQVGGQHITAGSWVGFYGHSNSFTGGGTEKTYVFSNTDFNYWNAIWDNLADYQYVVDNAAKDGVEYLAPRAKVMQTLLFQQLVDMYGDIPYSQALKGVIFITPKYDDDQFVYEDLIKKLDTAVTQIKALNITEGAEDVLYIGSGSGTTQVKANKTIWVKLANTLKMRLLMRQSFMAGRDAYITGEIAKINAEGSGFITENIFINPNYQKAPSRLNPFYGTYGYNEVDAQLSNYAFRKVGAPIVNFLKATSDSFRLFRIAAPIPSPTSANALPGTSLPDPNKFANYIGVPLGAASGFLEGSSSSIGAFQIVKGEATRPSILITNAEKFFLLAEAAQRYNVSFTGESVTTAQGLYEAGVNWAFRLVTAAWVTSTLGGYTAADAAYARYMTQNASNPLVSWTAATDKVRTILVQKWVSLIHVNALEAWSDYRKSNGTPSVSVPSSVRTVASTSASEPVRLFYPLGEESNNGANVPKNVNVYTNRIFWDVN